MSDRGLNPLTVEAAVDIGYQVFPDGSGVEHYKNGFEMLVGPLLHKLTDSGWHFMFRVGEQHLNPAGTLHGGMATTFIDHVLGGTAFHEVGRRPCITVSLHTDFLASASLDEWVEGEAKVNRVTGNLAFVSGRLFVNERTIALASGVWRIF